MSDSFRVASAGLARNRLYCVVCDAMTLHTVDQGEWICADYEEHA